jgi:microsomal dipeptidase-like Zn-dependent dipeptidase
MDPWAFRTSLESMRAGNIQSAWAAHYVPESELGRDLRAVQWIAGMLSPKLGYRELRRHAFDRLRDMIDRFSSDARAHARIATSFNEYEASIEADGLTYIHTVEGAHAFTVFRDGEKSKPDIDKSLRNLDILADEGVASLTLAHFYPNALVDHLNAIPKCDALARRILKTRSNSNPDHPLTDLGREVIARCAERGVLIDLTHCSVSARAAIFDFVETLTDPPPLVLSHAATRSIWTEENTRRLGRDAEYALCDKEIERLVRNGGAIGLVFSPYWLYGRCEGDGIEAITKSAIHVAEIAARVKSAGAPRDWSHVMLGTDFDGLTHPPHDLLDYSEMGRLFDRFREHEDISAQDLEWLSHKTAMRVLRETWGRRGPGA